MVSLRAYVGPGNRDILIDLPLHAEVPGRSGRNIKLDIHAIWRRPWCCPGDDGETAREWRIINLQQAEEIFENT